MRQSKVKQTYATGELGLPSEFFFFCFFFFFEKVGGRKGTEPFSNMAQGRKWSSKCSRHAAV